jgi:hypothetical protein
MHTVHHSLTTILVAEPSVADLDAAELSVTSARSHVAAGGHTVNASARSTIGGGEMIGRKRTWRRVVLLGVPSLYILLGLVHPTANPELGDETDLFIWLHIAQLFLIMGLGYVLWLLVEGVTNRAATLARALIIPFLVAYTALDAILGIAWGIAAETANDLPTADQQEAGGLIDELISGDPDPRGLILYWGAGLLWLAVALTVVAALRDTAPLGALVSMAMGAAIFTLGHAPPMGPAGMGLFLFGIAWSEFRPPSAEPLIPAAGA